jgi:hypothetical protein
MAADAENLVLVIGAVHVIGLGMAAALLLMVLRADTGATRPVRRHRDDEDDDGGGGGAGRPEPPPDPQDGGVPLPDASPARVRLRDHRRLAEAVPAQPRRSSEEPERVPEREPADP